ncbi:MAG: Fe-S oxidoreductase [Proteobacteria bacterium]|nr:Fe-S oxidoreductase [Pseudomonadota bacterium]MDE3209024.1 Fe-S oxidoreductase [Pseudomonadota bacterium]
MAKREGNLDAPTRHPIDWNNPDFYNEELLFKEMERVFDICHGCRRCFNLCTSFPTLFDAIDEGETGEVDGIPRKAYWDVTDQCYLCDMCFMTKCPYVPPHPFNLDFPHLMLRAKAIKFKKGETTPRDRLLTSTDMVGRIASIPVVAQMVNVANRTRPVRSLMSAVLGIHPDRKLPEYTSHTFRKTAQPNPTFEVRDGKLTSGKVAIFSTCYVNYNEPGIGHDLLKVLAHNEIPAIVVEKEACCGMPKLELGDLEAIAALKDVNIPVLAELAAQGYAILTAVPSCTLMFKQELPLLYPDDKRIEQVRQAMFDPFEYLMLRHRDGLLKTDFVQPLGHVSYHIPCHLRVQNMGQKTRETLELIPGTEVNTVERCSGHDGTWGVKKEYFDNSMKIGRPVFRQMSEKQPDFISSDCAIAGRHIQQGIGQDAPEKIHPLTLLRMAYGMD